MLHRISIENFFSIADQQGLILPVPDNAPNLPCFVRSRSDKDLRLPTVVGLFGPNASGKSTVLRALVSTAYFAIRSVDFKANDITAITISTLFQPYRQKKWMDKPTKIVIEFDGQLGSNELPVIFRYELHISHHMDDFFTKEVDYEALFYAPKGKFRCLFERKGQTFNFGDDFDISNNDPRKDAIRSNASVLSTLAKFNHKLSDYFCQLVGAIEANFMGFIKIEQNATQLLSIYAKDKDCLDELNKQLRRLDVGLEYMLVESGSHGLFAKFKHTGLDNFILFLEESRGTQKFIDMFIKLHYSLKTGGIAIIDEIDTDLHPLLLPELLRWFSSIDHNPYGAQLFFTAHNPTLLSDLEKEQIFFTEKLCGESTHVYGARDIKGLRREPSLMKKYLGGELGAVPHIG